MSPPPSVMMRSLPEPPVIVSLPTDPASTLDAVAEPVMKSPTPVAAVEERVTPAHP